MNVGTYRNISPCAISKGQDYLFFNSMSVLRRKHEFRLLTNKQQVFLNVFTTLTETLAMVEHGFCLAYIFLPYIMAMRVLGDAVDPNRACYLIVKLINQCQMH